MNFANAWWYIDNNVTEFDDFDDEEPASSQQVIGRCRAMHHYAAQHADDLTIQEGGSSQHVTSNVACTRSQQFTNDSVF